MKIALVQMNIAWEHRSANYHLVESLLSFITHEKPDIACLPELFSTGYTMNSGDFSETLEGKTVHFLSKTARAHGTALIGSLIERSAPKPGNSAVVIDHTGTLISHYTKINLPTFLHEHNHFSPGKKPVFFEIGGVPLSVVICYDLRFPELFTEIMRMGVKGVFVIANWPAQRIEHWDLLLRARAIENQLFIFGVNRVGNSPVADYNGHTMIIDPLGRVAGRARDDREEILIADIEFSLVDEIRETLPLLKDRC